MDILIAIGLVVVGGVIGFFIAQFMFARQHEQTTSRKMSETDIKAVMTQQAEHHVFQAKQTLEGLQTQIDSLKEQFDDYEEQLQPNEDDGEKADLSFFGEQTTAMLRNAYKSKKVKKDKADEQPRDFANDRSGLFVDDKARSNERN